MSELNPFSVDQVRRATSANDVVTIDGATGYVGSHLSQHLQLQGWKVRCLVRPQAKAADIAMLKSCGAEIFQADLSGSSAQLEKSFAGSRAAIHLIGSVAPKRGETFEQLHIEQTENFVQMCQKAEVPKVIMVTALGTAADALSQYHKSKWLAEEKLRASDLSCIFIRPSLLVGKTFGLRDSKLLKRMRQLIEKREVVPILGNGENKIQPLFIADAVNAISKALTAYPAGQGKSAPILELGGPEVMTMKQLVQEFIDLLGYQRKIISIPNSVANILATFAEIIQEVPIISRDQVKLSMIDNICIENDLTTKLGIAGSNVRQALKSYTGDGLVAIPGRN